MFLIQVNKGTDERGDPLSKEFKGLPIGYPLGVARTFKQAEIMLYRHYHGVRQTDIPRAGYLIVVTPVDGRIGDPIPMDEAIPQDTKAVAHHVWFVPPSVQSRFNRSPMRVYKRSSGVFPSEDASVTVRKPKRATAATRAKAAEVVDEEF